MRARADAASEAGQRFERALQLVAQGDLKGGLAEFHAAHGLVRTPVVAFNLGLVYAALGRPVEAVASLEEALAREAELPASARAKAHTVREEQARWIGHLTVEVSAREGALELDNVEVARLPLSGPLSVASGQHVVGVLAPGHAPARKEVLVASGLTSHVVLAPQPIDGRLAHVEVVSSLIGAAVSIDEQLVGVTPLAASVTVAPGEHTVRVARAGYRDASTRVPLGDGARARVVLDPALDRASLMREGGELSVTSSEPLSAVSVDGAAYGLIGAPLLLPRGPHRVLVEHGGFYPAERTAEVPRGERFDLTVELQPTPDYRARYVERARRARRWRGAALGLSGAGLLTGGVLAILGFHGADAAAARLRAVERDWQAGGGGACDPTGERDVAVCSRRLNAADAEVNQHERLQIAGLSLIGAGAVATGVSLWLLLRSDDPLRYERRAPARQGLELLPTLGPSAAVLHVRSQF